MAEREIDLSAWPRSAHFRFFRSFAQPHFSVTARIDVTRLITVLKPAGVSPYRACLYALGAGANAVPELRTRFRGDRVFEHSAADLSMTVPLAGGGFAYGYVPFDAGWARFDASSKAAIAAAKSGGLAPNTGGRDDLIYLSCMPWVDFTALTNALSGPDDCIPRIAWGRFTEDAAGRHSMAVAVEVNHAIADGEHLGRFFLAAQTALDSITAA